MTENVATADRVAELLRGEVIEGRLVADQRLKDLEVAERFDVSRSTAREALRILVGHGLVTARLNSGVAVRRLSLDELHDIYEVRRLVEVGALARAPMAPERSLEDLRSAVETTERCDAAGDWRGVGTSSIRFHQAIARLAGSPLLDAFFANVLAQLRLVLALMPDEGDFQQQWVGRDREILDAVLAGRTALAQRELQAYLDDSESMITEHLRARARGAS